MIEVEDTGNGNRPRTRVERVFERFYRGSGSLEQEGFGLGLSIARRMVDVMGGEIGVESEVGQRAARSGSACARRSPPRPRLHDDRDDRAARILVADDEPSVRDAVGYALEQEGFDVTLAEDGDDADGKLGRASSAFDLLILDIMMPGRSGLDLCRDVRARSPVPIILLTAKDAEVDKVVGLEVGADDYVTKPFSVRELLGRVRAQLRRRELDRGVPDREGEDRSRPAPSGSTSRAISSPFAASPSTSPAPSSRCCACSPSARARSSAGSRSWRSSGSRSSPATSAPATSTSPTCARRSSATRRTRSWC